MPSRSLAVVALAGAALLLAPAAQAVAPDDALASAAYGQAEVWLRRNPADRTRRQLVFQPARDAAPQVLDLTVPQRERCGATARTPPRSRSRPRTAGTARRRSCSPPTAPKRGSSTPSSCARTAA